MHRKRSYAIVPRLMRLMRLMRLAPLLLLAACVQRPPPPGTAGPVETVDAFAAAVQRGDPAGAYQLLSSQTQRDADAAAARARTFAGDAGTGPTSGRQMLFSSALPQGKITAHKIAQRGDDDATVEVKGADGKAQQFHVVREEGSWKLDLSTGPALR